MASSTQIDKDAIPLTNDVVLQPWEAKWLDYGQDLVKNSSDVLNEAAKYLISLISGVMTLYAGALGYLGIKENAFSNPENYLLVIPSFIFIASTYFGVLLLNPRIVIFRPDDVGSIKRSFKEITNYKYKMFKCCVYSFLLGIFIIVVLIILLPLIASPQEKTMVKFTVPAENEATLKAMGFTFDTDTLVTYPVEKVDDAGSTYTVKINGNKIAFDKNLVIWANYTS